MLREYVSNHICFQIIFYNVNFNFLLSTLRILAAMKTFQSCKILPHSIIIQLDCVLSHRYLKQHTCIYTALLHYFITGRFSGCFLLSHLGGAPATLMFCHMQFRNMDACNRWPILCMCLSVCGGGKQSIRVFRTIIISAQILIRTQSQRDQATMRQVILTYFQSHFYIHFAYVTRVHYLFMVFVLRLSHRKEKKGKESLLNKYFFFFSVET